MGTLKTFQFQKIEEIESLAPQMASFFPDAALAETGLRELMINAVEHGNLEIGFDTKTTLLEARRLHEEIERRLKAAAYCKRKAYASIYIDADLVQAEIRDEGQGFNWEQHLVSVPVLSQLAHGRGIMIAKQLCFHQLRYNPKGNCAIATVWRAPSSFCARL